MRKLATSLHLHPAKADAEIVSVPTEANTITEIKAYLDTKGISYTSSMTKAELLNLINS